jgi:tetratricopeptide (TPR) repeat protein
VFASRLEDRRLLPVAILLLMAGPAVASAQPEPADAAEARALFEAGVERADAGDWEAAAERFRASLARRPSPVVTYNLASALAHSGRPAEARETLDALLDDPSLDAGVRADARALRAQVQASLGTLRLELRTDAPLTVRVDGDAVEVTPSVALPLSPGAHAVEVTSPGHAPITLEARVEAGTTELLRVPAPRAAGDDTALHWGIGLGVAGGALAASLAFLIGLLASS